MKVSTERIPQSQVVLTIEVEPERVQGALDSAFRRLAPRTRIPGFRPGKAPRPMVERYLGHERLLEEALDKLVPAVYREAVEQEGVEVIDLPHLAIESTDPLVVKATVPVRPTVNLGDYRSLRIPRPLVEVPEERVDEALDQLRHRYATLVPVQRPVQWNDILRADVFGRAGDVVLLDEHDIEFRLREGQVISFPGFAENLIGMEKGATKEFEVPVPDGVRDQRLRGRTCHYRVVLREIKEELLPDLDDEFARGVGEGFPSMAALRERVRADIVQAEEEAAEHRYHDEIVSELVERAEMDFPDVLVEREIERLLRERAGQGDQDLERYLRQAGRSQDELEAELRPIAEMRVKRSLVLTEVADAEHIDVGDEDVALEIERLAASAGPQAESLRRLFENDSARDSVRRSLLTRKTLHRLTAIAAGEEIADEAAAAVADPQAAPAESDTIVQAGTATAGDEPAEPQHS